MILLTWWETFKLNLHAWYQQATVWVLGVWGVIGIYWNTMMTEADHQSLYDMVPWGLGRFVPPALFAISYFAAHGWPQPKLEAKLETAKVEAVANSAAIG